MKRKMKFVCVGLVIIAAFTCISTVVVGNYFVNYALVLKDGKTGRSESFGGESSTDLSELTDLKLTIKANQEKAWGEVAVWLETVETKDVTIESNDGYQLAGREYFADKNSSKWVVLVHGYTSKKEDMEDIAYQYTKQGYHVLLPDLRCHGESEGDFIGMGWTDRLDLIKWIEFLTEDNSDIQIILHGVSMGAATVMMTSGEELPEQVKAIVEDCGYTSVWAMFSEQLNSIFNLSSFPVLDMANLMLQIRGGYDMKDASALEQVKKSTTPILFIHGEADMFVPTNMVYPLYDAATCDKNILIVEGAGHVESKDANPELYYNTVFDFINKYIN